MSQCALGPGICHLFFARGRGIATLFLPDPRNCQLKEKKVQMPGGCPGGGGWAMLELTDALAPGPYTAGGQQGQLPPPKKIKLAIFMLL